MALTIISQIFFAKMFLLSKIYFIFESEESILVVKVII